MAQFPYTAEEIKKLVMGLKGRIVNVRIGNDNPRWRQIIVQFPELPSGLKPDNLIGRKVVVIWKDKKFKGRIYRTHGRKSVRVMLDKPLPGQALGRSVVEIIG